MNWNHTLDLIAILLQVIFLEGVLSLDNAAVLGAIVLSLPDGVEVPWPKALRGIGQPLNRVLGNQRSAALRVGLLGAYLGRGLMLLMASFVIQNQWLQLIGALYLLKISVSELGQLRQDSKDEDEEGRVASDSISKAMERGFWATVLMVELMDLAFSLDNVVVVVSLSKELWLVMLGVAAGILTMRFAAGIFTHLIERVPLLSTAAYVLVFNIGVEFLLIDLAKIEIPNYVRFSINIGILLGAVALNYLPGLQRTLKPVFRLAQYLMFALDKIFWVVFYPFSWLFSQIASLFRSNKKQAPAHYKAGD